MKARKKLIVRVKKGLLAKIRKNLPKKKIKPLRGYRIDLRIIDDKLIESIALLDLIIDGAIFILVSKHPNFIIDYLLNQTYTQDIGSGGVRIFEGSRKKEKIKIKLLDLISYVTEPSGFVNRMNEQGLIRGVKESIFSSFISNFGMDAKVFLKHYGDPFPTYRKLYPRYVAYNQLKRRIIRITFVTLPKIVLSRYKGWAFKRTISSTGDFLNYEEDVQNSIFSIKKALSIFYKEKHRSFFSYVTQWIKEGISSSPYTIDNSNIKIEDESGNLIDVQFEPVESTENNNFIDKQVFSSYIESLWEEKSPPKEGIRVLDFFEGSFPLPNEVRVLYRLLNSEKC